MQILFYPALLLLLLWGSCFSKKGEWNEDVLSFTHTKAFLGFCSVLIVFHHAAQRTCAPWLAPYRIRHGLDFFVFIGYLCVAAFFFCSGYGLYTSSYTKTKKDFFRHYLRKRLLPILTPTIVIWLVFFFIEKAKNMNIEKPIWLNTYDYIWFIPAILYLYIIFFFSYALISNEKISFALLTAGCVLYFLICMFYSPGTWWYNTPYVFLLGVLTAKHKDKVLSFLKKGYLLWLILSALITVAAFLFANYYPLVIGLWGGVFTEKGHFWGELIGQLISSGTFVLCMLLIGMKLRIGNPVLKFLGGFTLEFYLVHPLFIQLFGFAFVKDDVKPLYYIEDQFLYLLAVLGLSVPLAFLLHRLVTFLWKGSGKTSAAEQPKDTEKE